MKKDKLNKLLTNINKPKNRLFNSIVLVSIVLIFVFLGIIIGCSIIMYA